MDDRITRRRTCLRIRRGNRSGRRGEALLLIPPGLLSLVALTNDLHFWVYQPKIDLSAFAVETGAYTHMPAFYALYAWMILSFAAGLLLLFRETRSRARKAFAYLVTVVGLWFGLFTVYALVFDGTALPRIYNNPDIHMFGMLGVLEVCIRFHLIPHNASNADCFAALRTPALVTDEALRPVCRSGAALADAIDMAETIGVDVTLAGPVPQEDPGRSLLAAAIQECAANAVKHAGGSALSVRIRKEETGTRFSLANNGAPPAGPIRETGGLLSLRTLTQSRGGRMDEVYAPAFRLDIFLPYLTQTD